MHSAVDLKRPGCSMQEDYQYADGRFVGRLARLSSRCHLRSLIYIQQPKAGWLHEQIGGLDAGQIDLPYQDQLLIVGHETYHGGFELAGLQHKSSTNYHSYRI